MTVVYPYCYDLSPDPILSLTWWIKQCSWTLPANTEWVNKYFEQKLQNGGWSPQNKPLSYYNNNVNTECSYKCIENYTWDGTSCVASTKKANCEWNIPLLAEAKPWHGTYTQTWNGSTWTPPSKSWSYDESECGYKCKTNYTWNGSSCVLWTGSCWTKPTWSGYKFWTWIYTYGYTPTSWTYTGGTLWPCLYKCDTGYIWNSTNKKCEIIEYKCTTNKSTSPWYIFTLKNPMNQSEEKPWTHIADGTAQSSLNACEFTCDLSSKYYYSTLDKCEYKNDWCKTDGTKGCANPANVKDAVSSDPNKEMWDCIINWVTMDEWCFRCKDGYTWNGSKCENEKKYKICYMWSNKYRVADNEPLPFLLDITVRCGIWVWEVFNKTYTINTWDLISTWWLPNRSCEIINAQYEPSLFNPEDRVEYIWTCEWSCFGCPSGIVENGGTCVSYNISSSCDKYEWCAQWKIISKCTDGQRDYEPWEFLTCGEYTWSEKVCVWSWKQYNTYYQDRNQSRVGCEHFHPSTQEWMYVGMDCSKICVLDSVGNCVVDNNIVDNLKYCCNCQKVNICSLEIPRCANYGELKNRCKNRYSRSFLHPEYPWWAS